MPQIQIFKFKNNQLRSIIDAHGEPWFVAKDYGHHFSGYRRSDECEPSQGFMHRLVLWIVVYAVCVGWMMTHMGCAHPIENGIAALIGFGFVPLRLIDLVLSEAGVE